MARRTAKRIRRTPEAAKLAILEAAERRLIEDGPDGVRVQHIAADLGITGAALPYPFGSRETLIDAVRRYSAMSLLTDFEAIMEALDAYRLYLLRPRPMHLHTYTPHCARPPLIWISLP